MDNPFSHLIPSSPPQPSGAGGGSGGGDENPFAHLIPPSVGAPQIDVAPRPTALQKAIEPITSLPGTYEEMRRESGQQMDEGIGRVSRAMSLDAGRPRVGPFPSTKANIIAGAGETALGAAGYAASPIGAAIRTVAGKPIEETTGIPKEYTELAASLALPVPKRIPLPARTPAKTVPTIEELFDAADEGYKAARASKFQMAPAATAKLQSGIADELAEAGYRDFLVPKTFRAIGEFKINASSNVADIEAVRRALNIAAKDPAEKDAARRAIMAIDDRLSRSVPEIAGARGNYAAASRAEEVAEAVRKAELQAAAANSGQNIGNATRQQFKAILNSPARRRGFSADELAQMETIVTGSRTADASRAVGNVMGGGGGLGTMLTSAVGAAATGGWGAVAPVFGYAFKKLSNRLTSGQVTKLDEMVRARSPLGQAVGSSVRNWSEAAQAFETAPSVKNFVRMSIASRNLANTAHSAGITTTAEDLMRSLQGPVRGSTEGEQPQP